MTLFGPVFYYDLVRQSRRRFIPVLRLLYLIALFLVLYVANLSWSRYYTDGAMPAGQLAAFVESFFSSFLGVQFLVVLALTPALTAGAITEEKESQTLPFLLASPLYRHEIILGKLASRLGALLLIVLAGLPVFSLLQLLGGVDPGWLWAGFVATGVTMLSLAAVSLFWSTVLPRSRDAVLFAYLTPPAYLLLALVSRLLLRHAADFPSTEDWTSPITLGDIIHAFNAGEPFQGLAAALSSTRSGSLIEEVVGRYCLFHAIVAALAVTAAMWRVRRAGLPEEARLSRKGKGRVRRRLLYGGRPAIGDNPILWREVYAERGAGLHWIARTGLLFFVGLSFVMPIEFLLESHQYYGSLPFAMNGWVRAVGSLVACLLLLGIAIRAAGTFTSERHKQTFDVLLTTPLSTDTILFGKWLGCLASVGWGWLWLGSIAGLGLVTGGLHLAAFPLLCLCWGSYAGFLAVLGIRFSLKSTTTLRATVRTIGIAGLLAFGPYFLLGCCSLVMFTGGSDLTLVKFVMGFCPPSALYFTAFILEDRDFHFEGGIVAFSLLGAMMWAVAALILWNATREEFRKLAGRKTANG